MLDTIREKIMRGRGGGAHAGKNNLNNIFSRLFSTSTSKARVGCPPPLGTIQTEISPMARVGFSIYAGFWAKGGKTRKAPAMCFFVHTAAGMPDRAKGGDSTPSMLLSYYPQ